MHIEVLKDLFETHKESRLYHRYITNAHIQPLFKKLESKMTIETIGLSVLKKPVYGIKIGSGAKKILMWSQMHGNESTTTKALFDLINTLSEDLDSTHHILNACSLYIIPILNPDGAESYTRVNANNIDLNRDAQALSQPESKILRQAFNAFKPDFCYNLHGQRTIFSAGKTNHPATVSFLAPAQDEQCTVTSNRKIAMELIAAMNATLQMVIPDQVGVYDDAFNLNCVGDTFQSLNTPTILFEAGHYANDYARDITRKYIYMALLQSLDHLALNRVEGVNYQPYFDIPENDKCFYDIIIRKALVNSEKNGSYCDIGLLYQEILKEGVIAFMPKVAKMGDLSSFFGHQEISAHGQQVLNADNKKLEVDSENVVVIVNNEKISLLLK
ncbi:M14 metallopeptidase family protein [Gaetbulibacter aquiaggeris]|uniref:M14 metallopeptidase family protein n=1 Tax=Gaetbulibacter aquiaggeris TaxID=1735373 RepID=A0ABW7MQZ6_9FLAO